MSALRPNLAELHSVLDSDETVLWSGTPFDGVIFRLSDVLLIPFSIFWAGFALFWNVVVWGAILVAAVNAGGLQRLPYLLFVFPIFGAPFLVMGYYVTIGRFQHDQKERNRSLYAVTQRRAIVVRGPGVTDVRGFELLPGSEITVTSRGNASGTIRFGGGNSFWTNQSWQVGIEKPLQFERIEKVRDVAKVIDDVIRKPSLSSPTI